MFERQFTKRRFLSEKRKVSEEVERTNHAGVQDGRRFPINELLDACADFFSRDLTFRQSHDHIPVVRTLECQNRF